MTETSYLVPKLHSILRRHFRKSPVSTARNLSVNFWLVAIGVKPAYLLDQVIKYFQTIDDGELCYSLLE